MCSEFVYGKKGGGAMFATGSMFGAQALTFAVPVGTLAVVCLWFFFQRHANR
jgi:hypothetical protein